MWSIDSTKILTEREIAAVLTDLRRRRSINSHQNLIVFRLSTCCGLRVSEICGLRLSDVHVGVERPYVHVRRQRNEHGERKPKRSSIRRIALWWDGGTLAPSARRSQE
jgi:integrase